MSDFYVPYSADTKGAVPTMYSYGSSTTTSIPESSSTTAPYTPFPSFQQSTLASSYTAWSTAMYMTSSMSSMSAATSTHPLHEASVHIKPEEHDEENPSPKDSTETLEESAPAPSLSSKVASMIKTTFSSFWTRLFQKKNN